MYEIGRAIGMTASSRSTVWPLSVRYAGEPSIDATICSLEQTPAANVPPQFAALAGACKLNGIDPQAYLRYVLVHIADHAINCIGELALWVVADELRTRVR